jgi:hypothetical protein
VKEKTKRPRLGDVAPDFLAQWNSSKAATEDAMSARTERKQTPVSVQERNLDEALHRWKKDGSQIGVAGAKLERPSGPRWKTRSTHMRSARSTPSTQGACATRVRQRDESAMYGDVARKLYRAVPEAAVIEPKKPLCERVREVSADVRLLRIGGAVSRRAAPVDAGPVVENHDGKVAVLGLDFGTAFTKAVIQSAGYHYAVDWSEAIEGDDRYLMASVFSEKVDGSCVLGACQGGEWKIHDGIKLSLLSSSRTPTGVDLASAVIFQALAFRYASAWLRSTRSLRDQPIRWRLHVGLPTQSWDDTETTATFKEVAQAARLLACTPGPISRRAAIEALETTGEYDRPAVDVFPEFACQLYSYLRSAERQSDLHALIDIGAGTVDVAFFNVFVHNNETVLPIFAADVRQLGAHYLIAALAGPRGTEVQWDDRDSSMSDVDVVERIGGQVGDVERRRRLFLNAVADMLDAAKRQAKSAYATSPAFRKATTVRLFRCGGGSRIASFRKRLDEFETVTRTCSDINFQVSELVQPDNIVGKFDANFDRLSVAYGLSQHAANIGGVMRSADLTPFREPERPQMRDRDDDR